MWRRVDRNVYCNFDALGNNWMQIVELLTPPGVDTVIRRVGDLVMRINETSLG